MPKNNLKILNTLTNKKEPFKPLKGKVVNMFVCGPTVYDYSHLGHARNYIVFDIFTRYLRYLGYKVFYLQNITDVDDKIIARAREKGVSPKDLAIAFEKEHIRNMKALGVTTVSKYARATDYIKEIVSQIDRLQEKGFAYEIPGDGIYFDISKFKRYGKLSGRTALQAEDAVSRIDYSRNKKNRGDFCLWKLSNGEEPSWPSPFGTGRPGWHIEDTAITEKFFGDQYDLHGGARDLIFPHHEAEIAQMEAISGKAPMVNYWMHVGFLTVDGQKMSKSLNNFITINDFLKRTPANLLRFFVAKNLWSSPIDYTESMMVETKVNMTKMEEFLRRIKAQPSTLQQKSKSVDGELKLVQKTFLDHLDDNFNTPKAFSALFEFIKKINQELDTYTITKAQASKIYAFFEKVNHIFEFIDFKKINQKVPTKITALAQERDEYRRNGNWQKSDEIRRNLEQMGYIVEDTKNGTVIKIA